MEERHVVHGSFNLVASLLEGTLLRIGLHGRRGLVGKGLAGGVRHVVNIPGGYVSVKYTRPSEI